MVTICEVDLTNNRKWYRISRTNKVSRSRIKMELSKCGFFLGHCRSRWWRMECISSWISYIKAIYKVHEHNQTCFI